MRTEVVQSTKAGAVEQAVRMLRRGGLVAFPTDTVYGLGTLAFDGSAVARLYQAKGRSEGHAIPVLLGDLADLDRLASPVTAGLWQLANAFWPGALTLVVGKHAALPAEVSAGVTVGLRMPDHRLALDLLAAAGPMAVTSANRSGGPSLTSAEQVLSDLGGRIDMILDGGDAPGGEPSTVVDLTHSPPRQLRAGPIPLEKVLHCLEAA